MFAEELLRNEGFTDVQYVKTPPALSIERVVVGDADLSLEAAPAIILELDTREAIVVLAGVHVGCFELFGTERVRRVAELRGKTVAVPRLGGGRHAFVASMAAQIGIDPHKEITWVEKFGEEAVRLLAEGKIDAYLGFPPEPQEMRAKQIGHVVVNTATDRPWSQYFCCMTFANREFVRRHPVATKRALRALLKADGICALEPDLAARTIVNRGFASSYE
jgi:NitT/TauT family transport system substrate-binding protein